MFKKLASLLGLLALAATATLYSAHAQSNNTWSWTGLTGSLSQTAVFTPASTSAYIITASASISGAQSGGNDGICTVMSWTDPQTGNQSTSWCAFDYSDGGTAGSTTGIHVQANIPVYVSTNKNGTWVYAHPYNLILTALKQHVDNPGCCS